MLYVHIFLGTVSCRCVAISKIVPVLHEMFLPLSLQRFLPRQKI